MKLVYLDTSHISLLTDVYKNNLFDFQSFIEKWKEAKYILTISKAHIEEVMQLSSSATRDFRFKVLSEFIPFRYETENFFEREIQIGLFKNGLLQISETDRITNLKIFSKSISNNNELELIKKAHSIIRASGLYSLTSFANRSGWKAMEKDKIHISPKPKLKNVKNNFLFRFFTKFVGIDASDPNILRKTFESTLNNFLFRTQLKSTLKNHFLITDKTVITNIEKKISRSDCLGLWLRSEIKTRLKLAKDFAPNNEKDLEHIQYLPYVDLLFTDKRMVEITIQVLRSPNLPEGLKNISSPMKVSQSLESLEKSLFDS